MMAVLAMKLVLLHPLPFDGSIWASELGDLAPMVTPTLYQMGESIEEWASGVAELIGSGPVVLVGNSVGGSCAIEVARLVPERVALLALIGTKPGHRPEPALRDDVIRTLTEQGTSAAWERYWAPLFAPSADPEVLEGARALACSQDVEDLVRGTRVFHSRPDRSRFLEGYGQRVVIVNGEYDRPERAAQLAADHPQVAFHGVPGAGHYVPIERPALLTALLSDFVSAL